MWRARFHKGLNLALLALLAWLPLGTVARVSAHHNSGFYLQAIRSVEWWETYCVDSYKAQGIISFQEAFNRVVGTLQHANPGEDWHGLNYDHVFFEPVYNYNCSDVDQSAIEIRYNVAAGQHMPYPTCWYGGQPFSCALPEKAIWNPDTSRTEYNYYNVWLKGDVLAGAEGTYRHLINHETGHVLGLYDGGPNWDAHRTWDTSCPGSIMHSGSYDCRNPDGTGYYPWWPTALDFDTVWRLTLNQPAR
jgi:hypothetical protein